MVYSNDNDNNSNIFSLKLYRLTRWGFSETETKEICEGELLVTGIKEKTNVNFSAYAKNCGALGIRVTKKEELLPALEQLKAHNGPALLEIITDATLI